MALETTVGTIDGILLLTLAGELDISTVPRFEASVEAPIADVDCVVIDIREVSLVDSSGLGCLLRLARSGGPQALRAVALVVRGPRMPRLLELTKLADRFILLESLDDVAPAITRHRLATTGLESASCSVARLSGPDTLA